jgi:sulfite dehydrogenase (cytochrome) subunit B
MRSAVILAAFIGCVASASARAEDPVPLKPGEGGALASAACNACHTSNYIIMNSVFIPAAGWKAEVTKMRTAYGAPIDDATAESIIGYLSEHYAAKK